MRIRSRDVMVAGLTLAAVAATLALVALMASLVPAYRASQLDPVKTLRGD